MMSKINQTDIDRLIELVGGRGNIATVSHCITRLRFVLNQPANARPKEIEQLPMVKGCFTNAGQFQVVIGTNVGDYYQALIASTGQAQVDKEQVKKAARQNMKWHEQLISHFAEIFFPLLPALISGGLILGFRNVIGDLPMSNGQTLVSGEKNGRHADPWYRAWRDTGFPPADERLSARAAAAGSVGLWHVQHRQSGLSGAGDPGTISRAGAGRY